MKKTEVQWAAFESKVAGRRERFIPVALLLGLTSVIEVQLFGQLMGTDIVCILGAFYSMIRRPSYPLANYTKILLLLVGLWLIGAIATDVYRGSDFADVARGQSRIIILFLGLFFLADISGESADWPVSFLLGLNTGLLLKGIFLAGYGFRDAPWKFGLGIGFACLSILVLERADPRSIGRRLMATTIFASLAAVSLLSDARSLFAVFALVALIVFARKMLYNFAFRGGIRPLSLLLLAAIAFGAAQGASVTYSYFAETGALGPKAKAKFEAQSALGLNALQAGRQESIVSIQAIKDSPFLGHGSWARDPVYTQMLVAELTRRGVKQFGTLDEHETIPSHSQILGAWVDHGILAVPFWLFTAFILLKGMRRAMEPDCIHREVILLFGFLAFWNLLFSPFGAQERVAVATICAIMVAELRSHVQRRIVVTSVDDAAQDDDVKSMTQENLN